MTADTLCAQFSVHRGGEKYLYYCRRNNAATYGCRRLKPAASLRKIIPSCGFTVERISGEDFVERGVSIFPISASCFPVWRIRDHQDLPPHSDSTPSEVAVLSPLHSFIYRPRRRSSCSNSAAICYQQPGLGTFHSHRGFGRRSVRQIILPFNKNKHGMMGGCSRARLLMEVCFFFFFF